MNCENNIYGFAYDCPVKERLRDCPFYEIEDFSFYEKVIWIKSINEEKRESIIQHHLFCSENRALN